MSRRGTGVVESSAAEELGRACPADWPTGKAPYRNNTGWCGIALGLRRQLGANGGPVVSGSEPDWLYFDDGPFDPEMGVGVWCEEGLDCTFKTAP
ncbi:hypothetical protein NDU88_007058 [Pleurodeles waltl]|uniref:Uncharacterized protein n=1 Tax=Pleurodeles waltl TaxID=8319 RepID=A0AAV7UPY9_PLEWA|nr:hypothetical protein NDU88_007058 [Pleurodeles waltl]